MSSFQDNFKRDSQEEEMLEYDDSAFYYFSISILSFLLIPYTYSILSKVFFGDVDLPYLPASCKCPRCETLYKMKK